MVKTWVVLAVVTVITSASFNVGAEVQHVVGDDRGWDPATDLASWSSGRTFRVGDKLWFAYSASHGTIAELNTSKEYESCDVINPIQMLTDGLDSVLLEAEGVRYFVSSNMESCKKGLKLPVEVTSQEAFDSSKVITSEGSSSAVAAGPAASSSGRKGVFSLLLVAGFTLCYMLY